MPAYQPPTQPWLDLVCNGSEYLVFCKPTGLLSVPGKNEPDCLETRVRDRFEDALIVHRLDMATSGIILFARGKTALADLGWQFESRTVEKRYVAVVSGTVDADEGTIDAPLRCDWPNRPLQMICHEQGRPATTHWKVLARGNGWTRLALTPVTGRSHQLRVHLTSIGHPILGDEWYGDETSQNAANRLLLHAEYLAFTAPGDGPRVEVTCPAPF